MLLRSDPGTLNDRGTTSYEDITALTRYNSSGTATALAYAYTGNYRNTFSYDANGNVSSDATNSLQSSYNLLNLPAQIKSGSTVKANYTYLSDGTKAAALNAAGTGYDYAGSFTYSHAANGTKTLESVAFGGGRIRKNGSSYLVDYHVTDHLGSVRAIVTNGSITEQNDYYPFGTRHSNGMIQLSANRWRFGGKEEQDGAFGIAYTDFGARFLAPGTASWTSIDPMAEKYYVVSPYVYCVGNPVRFVDPEGLSTWVYANENGTYTVFGGDLFDLDLNLNIYVYTKDESGEYTQRGRSIGFTPVLSSFFNSDINSGIPYGWQGTIDPGDMSGVHFLASIISNTPSLFTDYIPNATNQGRYDFKYSNGDGSEKSPGQYYRGMPLGINVLGVPMYSSARDIGNIAAGFVAGDNGMPWALSRAAFDYYETKTKKRIALEGFSSQNAQFFGWAISQVSSRTYRGITLTKSIIDWIRK